ncbi:type VII secretion protein EsaA [Metabacillus idriensis]|uniref:type VII secretion protein EsaA n=1 Tax=Metabacillus idriensis TaxID=324768 RepID=UPI00174BCEB8|nr:type VII secretion protein EsaA [Metabacillus idriensis]
MTDQRKHMIKMIAAVLLILAVPALFFQFIGDNPMEVREKATRNIAVVNEDIGAEEAVAEDADKEPVQFGKEIASILDEDSPYEWTVLSRSAAVNGLKSQQYDAVIYIPSNFSNNILTYDEQQPSKAEFEYTVQNQLNAENRQRVLRELEDATNRVNKQMSSLYWSYVSQDMENVRQEFDRILEKEIAFQKAMLGFYKPSSKDLAGELTQQKQMLEQLQSTMKQAEEDSPERKNSVEQFEKSLSAFVKYVEDYQTYQEDQQQLLTKAQQESITAIQGGTTEVDQKQEETQAAFDKQGEQLAGRMTDVQKLLDRNQKTAENLGNVRLSQTERQARELESVHSEYVDMYILRDYQDTLNSLEATMIPLRKKLQKEGTDNGDGPGNGEDNGNEETSGGDDITEPGTPREPGENENPVNMDEERAKILAISEQMNSLITNLETIPDPKPDQVIQALTQLDTMSAQLVAVEESIKAKESQNSWRAEYEKLLELYDQLVSDNGKLLEENRILKVENGKLADKIAELTEDLIEITNNMNSGSQAIMNQEQKVLNSLGDERKERLEEVFSTPIGNASMSDVLAYHSYLSQYEATVNRIKNPNNPIRDEVLKDRIQESRVKTILSINEEEQGAWDKLNQELPATEEEMKEVQASALAFMDQYSKDLEEQQTAIMEDLASMEESANTVLSQVQETDETVSRMPLQNSDGTTLVTNQQSIGQEIVMISDLMNSLGERQETVVSSTDALQQKVNEVQSEADLLNDKWATNVASTQLVRDDVFSILGNTLVDGQNNGYVYEHLANPLQISGDAPVTQAKAVPPVVILVIILISSLLIGYFSHYFKAAPLLVRGSMFGLLNLIVGLIISLFGLNIYTLTDERAIQWSIFTILLLFAASTIVRVAFLLGNFAGWLASVGLVAFFVSPLLALAAPNFTYEDPMSKVYISIQFDTNNLFTQGIIVLIGMIVVLTILPFVVNAFKNTNEKANQEHAHEM